MKMFVTSFNRFKNVHIFMSSIVWEIFCKIVDTNEVKDMLPHKDYEYWIFYYYKKKKK